MLLIILHHIAPNDFSTNALRGARLWAGEVGATRLRAVKLKERPCQVALLHRYEYHAL